MQGIAGEGLHLACGLLEGLRLHGPYDDGGAFQKRTGGRLGADAKLGVQTGTGLVKRLHHVQAILVKTALQQAADNRAGHVAATHKCNMLDH